MLRRLFFAPWAVTPLLALGCGSEVGEDYTGEALLDFHGSVTSDMPIPDDAELVMTLSGPDGIHLIDGVIEGDFPSDFRFSTTSVPPETEDYLIGGKTVKLALMAFAVVPKNHPAIFPPSSEGINVNDSTDPGNVSVQRTYCQGAGCSNEPCTGGAGCYKQDLSCAVTPCELLDSEGDPAIKDILAAPQVSGEVCAPGDACYSWSITCAPDTIDSCYRDAYRCDMSGAGVNDFADLFAATRFECEVIDELGDPSVPQQAIWSSVKSNFGIIWADQDAEDLEFGSLKAGYNIIKAYGSVAAWLDAAKCIQDRTLAAMVEYNDEHGTSYPPFVHNGSREGIDPAAIDELNRLSDNIMFECEREAGAGPVADTAQQDLAIEIVHVTNLGN
jgi:hypothetical protein